MIQHSVKGMTLHQYFKLKQPQSFEDQTDLDCLIGDLITKPKGTSTLKHKMEEIQENQQDEEKTNHNTKHTNNHLQQNKSFTKVINHNLLNRQSKLSKLSSLDLQSSPTKFYKSQKMRIRQISQSPYQRKLSKPKDQFKTLFGSPNLFLTQHYFAQNQSNQKQTVQNYCLNAASLSVKQKRSTQKVINLHQMNYLKQLRKTPDTKKIKASNIYNSVNIFGKKIWSTQKNKYEL